MKKRIIAPKQSFAAAHGLCVRDNVENERIGLFAFNLYRPEDKLSLAKALRRFQRGRAAWRASHATHAFSVAKRHARDAYVD